MLLKVGLVVRVYAVDGQSARRATVALVNDDGTADVLFTDEADSEACGVLPERIEALLPFELEETGNDDPAALKESGNHLFTKVKDYAAAMHFYARALRALASLNHKGSAHLSVGSAVLVEQPGSVSVKTGMVADSDEDARTVDVFYDDGLEEESVARSRLLALAEIRLRSVQRACFLNSARCCVKRELVGWAVKYASLALAVTEMLSGEYTPVATDSSNAIAGDAVWGKQAADCILLRGRSLLLAGRPGFASQDALMLAQLDPGRGAALLSEVTNYRKNRKRANKKLAKAVVGWGVSLAEGLAGSIPGGAGESSSAAGTDLSLAGLIGGDEDDNDNDNDNVNNDDNNGCSADVKESVGGGEGVSGWLGKLW